MPAVERSRAAERRFHCGSAIIRLPKLDSSSFHQPAGQKCNHESTKIREDHEAR